MNARLAIAGLLVFGTLESTALAQGSGVLPLWKAESNQISAGFGCAVSSAGDVNGDGFGDILVGAYRFADALDDQGSAAVFHGSVAGPAKTPDWTAVGDRSFANFGETVAAAGDVNGDGYDDVLVGAPQAGNASLYLGSRAGLGTSAAWKAQTGDYNFGWSVAGAGDVNRDGFDDVLVSALGYSNDQANEGRIYLYLGSRAGLATSPVSAIEGNQANASFGAWVSAAGDVNGDGFADVIVGAPRWRNGQRDEGRAFVYSGSAAGLVTSPAWSAESDQADALLGYWVASAGDVNGDGFGDVIVSANSYSHGENAEGRASVYQGSKTGLATTPAWTTESNQHVALAGAVSSGDLDGDGYSDVLVGYYSYDHGQLNEGAAFAYFGSPSGLATAPGWSAESNQRDSMFGYALAGAGDVNGDGYEDVVVGAYDFDAGQRDEGRAFVYLGSSTRRRH